MSFTPRSWAWWYGRPPANAGRNEWWMLMMRFGYRADELRATGPACSGRARPGRCRARRAAPATALSCAAFVSGVTGRWRNSTPKCSGDVRVVGVVADHERDLGGELAGPPPGEQVVQAVGLLRDEDGDLRALVGEAQHRTAWRSVRASGRQRRAISARSRSKPSSSNSTRWKKTASLDVGVLVGVHDVAAVPVHELGHRGHEALLVGAREQQCRCSHCPSVLPLP